MLKDTRYILVRAKCPYVQSADVARVINTERFVVGVQTVERGTCPKSQMKRSNGCRELGSCSAMCDVMHDVLNRSPKWGALLSLL